MRRSSITVKDMDSVSVGDVLNMCEHTGKSAIIYVDDANGDLTYAVVAAKIKDWKQCLESLLATSKHL